jgi:uncharacterized RDD family membrane protein YckC
MPRPEPQIGTHKEALPKRILAFLVDTVIIIILLGLFAISVVSSVPRMFLLVIITMFTSLLVTFFYAFLLEGYKGQTIGKMVMGIMVVKEDGSPCDYTSSFVRNLLRLVDGFAYYLVGLVAILVSENNQRIGDYMAGTLVVKTK